MFRHATLLSTICAFAACTNASAPAPAPDGGAPDPNTIAIAPVLIGQPAGSLFETEPSIAVAPDGRVAIVSLDSIGSTISVGFTFSPDRGVTWSSPQLLTLPQGRFASNEIVVADAQSNFYLVTLGVTKTASAVSVYMSKAPAGTSSFGDLVEVSDPAVVTLRDASAFAIAKDGSFNVVWTEWQGPTTSIVQARSTDGTSWARTSIAQVGVWPNICASRNSSHVAAVFLDNSGTGVRWSDDNGATWPEGNTNNIPLEASAGEFPSCITIDADLWVMQGVSDQPPSRTYAPTLSDIQITHSGDGGSTLDATVSAQDPLAGSRSMRAMAVIEEDRSISLAYYAGTMDDDPSATLRRSRSIDGGKTFLPSDLVYQPITLATSRTGTTALGDLLGITADARNTFVSFVDNADGKAHIRFARLAP